MYPRYGAIRTGLESETVGSKHVKYAVLFPGQGSQAVGMGGDVRILRHDLFGTPATEVLGWDLDELIELEDKTLVCFCKPLACHGDVLVKAIKYAQENIE